MTSIRPSGLNDWLNPEVRDQRQTTPRSFLHDLLQYHPGEENDEQDIHGGTEPEEGHQGPKRRRTKFTRSRTACLPCRSRKSKCGAIPPDPCPNCVEAHIDCEWPAEDGRSSKARQQRAKRKQYDSGSPTYDESGWSGAPKAAPQQHWNDSWLNGLMDGNGASNQASSSRTVLGSPTTHDPRTLFNGPNSASTSNSTNRQTHPVPTLRPPFGQIPSQSVPSYQDDLSDSLNSTSTLPLNLFPDVSSSQTPSGMDQFIWAFSSRLPTVEEYSPETTNRSGPSPSMGETLRLPKGKENRDGEVNGKKIVKVSWWRPHGQTAIAPGLKRITLKVRVDNPEDTWNKASPRVIGGVNEAPQEVIAPDGSPSTPVMLHLLDVFLVHFGCQFPFIERAGLEAKIEARTASVFLLNSIAAIAARFSEHPAIALPDLERFDYGNVFYNRSKLLLGSMLAVPSRETVTAFVLLAHMGFANDSESEVWQMTGLAVRMSMDLGLHLNPSEGANMSDEDRRLNRLVFWSVLLMDYALAFGVGRCTTYRVEEITQPVPTQDEIKVLAEGEPRSPFPFAARMMITYGPIINALNLPHVTSEDLAVAAGVAIREYNRLPSDMQWVVGNLQRHSKANQGSIFLHLHLWMHTILASSFLTETDMLRRANIAAERPPDFKSGMATPGAAAAANLWRNSARTIGDILVLSDIINPYAYYALPFVNQAFFVAGCCYVKEIEQAPSTEAVPPDAVGAAYETPRSPSANGNRKRLSQDFAESKPPMRDDGTPDVSRKDSEDTGKQVDLSRAILTSVATNNISTLQRGLEKQNVYWSGTAWIASALKQRIQGMAEIDLVGVTEKLASFVSLPDAGLVGRATETPSRRDGLENPQSAHKTGLTPYASGSTWPDEGFDGLGKLDLLSLPFDLRGLEGEALNVVEQHVPLPPTFDPQWFQ